MSSSSRYVDKRDNFNRKTSARAVSGKRTEENHQLINLNDQKRNIPDIHFNMEGLFLLKDMLIPGDLILKIDLKDAHFTMPLVKIPEIRQVLMDEPDVRVVRQ